MSQADKFSETEVLDFPFYLSEIVPVQNFILK